MIRTHLETPDPRTVQALDEADQHRLRKDVFSAIVDQGFPGSKMEDLSLTPRVIPAAYLEVIERGCRLLTEAVLRFAARDKEFILSRLKPDSRWCKLIDDHGVLDRTPGRMIGEIRYDFGIMGPLTEDNPPLLMEVNAGALGGVIYAGLMPGLLQKAVPGLDHLDYVDLGKRFKAFMSRVGGEIGNFCVGEYSWGEDYLDDCLRDGPGFHLVTPVDVADHEYWPKLECARWDFNKDGRLCLLSDQGRVPLDGFRWSRILEHRDIDRFGGLLRRVQDSATTYISPLRVDFVSHKGLLPLLHDRRFLEEELGMADASALAPFVIPSWNLTRTGFPGPGDRDSLVLKQNFGCSGKKVFVGRAMDKARDMIDDPSEWILQQRIDLNHSYNQLLYSQNQALRMDLGVFVFYDFKDGRFEHLEVSGMLSRGSARHRVNLNLGGACIPVLRLP